MRTWFMLMNETAVPVRLSITPSGLNSSVTTSAVTHELRFPLSRVSQFEIDV